MEISLQVFEALQCSKTQSQIVNRLDTGLKEWVQVYVKVLILFVQPST